MSTTTAAQRAIGIIRVSETGGREGDRFHSPAIQRERIERDCERHGLRLVDTLEELDVSGGKPLAKRPALARALAGVERGEVGAIVFAYRDRVDRSIQTGGELCRRMDAAEALLLADGQRITHSTHNGWRQATLESFLNEDQRRAISAKMLDVHRRSISEGRAPFKLPPGYRRRADGRSELDPRTSPHVAEAWRMRSAGEPISAIRRYLVERGVKLSLEHTTRMLRNRFYLGELHYGRPGVEPNLTAHAALIDRPLFDRVQRTRATRGRYGKSDALLARLGVLRCSTCDGRLSLSTRTDGRTFYRCSDPDCTRHMTISGQVVEGLVVDEVKRLLAGIRESASTADGVSEASAALESAQEQLDAAIRAFAALGSEPAAVERLSELQAARDAAREDLDGKLADRDATTVAVDVGDWDELSLDGRRGLIRAVIRRIGVGPGSGPERVSIEPALAA